MFSFQRFDFSILHVSSPLGLSIPLDKVFFFLFCAVFCTLKKYFMSDFRCHIHFHISFPPQVLSTYRHIIDKPRIITSIRNPQDQHLSWLNYFLVPPSASMFNDILMTTNYKNTQSGDYGCKSLECVEGIVDKFDLILVLERLPESLIVMRRMFDWDISDLFYLRLLDSHADGGT